MYTTSSPYQAKVNINRGRVRKPSRWTPVGIAAIVFGFMVWWPLGMGILAYIVWGGSVDDLISDGIDKLRGTINPASAPASSGNAAFDAYRNEVLRDLEKQQEEFDDFVEHLRQARDREEFERFMDSRKKPARDTKK